MVVDEAHCLKNPKGQRYKNMDAFSTDRRLLLTGEFSYQLICIWNIYKEQSIYFLNYQFSCQEHPFKILLKS